MKAEELNDEIKHYASQCRLDSWTAFVNETKVPGDIYPALATGRPELIALIQPRALSAEEAKVLFDIIATLIATNFALREHASKVAQFVNNWSGAFTQLSSVGRRVQQLANFDHEMPEEG